MRLLRSKFKTVLWSGSQNAEKPAECCRIFGFDSTSRQFIFNALS